jgi:hypothetical protein
VVIALYSGSRGVQTTYAELVLHSRVRMILRCIQEWKPLRCHLLYCTTISYYILRGRDGVFEAQRADDLRKVISDGCLSKCGFSFVSRLLLPKDSQASRQWKELSFGAILRINAIPKANQRYARAEAITC